MSQASIPVGIDVIWRSERAQADLKAFQGQVDQFVAKLSKSMADVPLKLDIGDAATQVDEFVKSMTRDAIKIPVAINDVLARAQFANLVEDITSKAIQVPIQFTVSGGIPIPGGLPSGNFTIAGGGTSGQLVGFGGSLAAPGGQAYLPSAPALMAAGTAALTTTAAAVATAQPLFAPGTTFGYIRGANYYPPAPMTASPMAGTPNLFPPATIFSPTNAVPVPAPYSNTAAGVAAATAAMASAGSTAGPVKWYQYGGMGAGVLSTAFAAMAAMHHLGGLAEDVAKLNPERFNMMADPMGQLRAYRQDRTSQHSTLRALADTSIVQWLAQPHFGMSTPFSSMAARAVNERDAFRTEMAQLNDAERYSRRAEARIARRKEEGAAVRGLVEQNDAMAAEDAAASGSTRDRAKALLDRTLTRTLDQADKILARFTNGTPERANAEKLVAQIKAHAQSIRDKAVEALDKEFADAAARMTAEASALKSQLAGDMTGARRAELEAHIAERVKALRKDDPRLAAQFENELAPLMRRGFEQSETTRRAGARIDSDARVAGFRQRGAEAGIRLRGGNEVELAEAQNRAIDEHVRQLERAAAIETDLEKKKQREAEAAAAKVAAEEEKALNLREARLKREMTLEAERHTAEMAHLEAEGRSWDATLAEVEERRKPAVEEARGDQQKVDAANATAAAQTALARVRHDEQVRSLDVSARQGELRATGRRQMADVLGVAEQAREGLAHNQNDPAMQAAIARGARSDLLEFLHPSDHAGFYSSAADYASALQTQALDNDGGARKEAERLIRMFGDYVEKFGEHADKPVKLPFGHIRS